MMPPPTRVAPDAAAAWLLWVVVTLAAILTAARCGLVGGAVPSAPMSAPRLFVLLLAPLLACGDDGRAATTATEPAQWGYACTPSGAECADGLTCNTSAGQSDYGYCSAECDADHPCVDPEICNAEGACTNPCADPSLDGCPLANIELQCGQGSLCVGRGP